MVEQQKVSSQKMMLNYGIVMAVINILIGVVLYATNNHLPPSSAIQFTVFVINIILVVLGIRAYKKGNGGFLKLTEALKVGIGISVIFGIIFAVWQYVFVTVIEPDFSVQMADIQREAMIESNPDMTDDQLDAAMSITENFSKPWIVFLLTIVWYLFIGFITSLIAGLIMKKENPFESA